MTYADRIEIESDERGFELHIWVDEEPEVHENGLMILNIQNIDLDAFYDQVKGRIGPWLRERDEARSGRLTNAGYENPRTYDRAGSAFVCNPDESGGYALDDPKHSCWHSVHADLWDTRAGK